MRLGSVKILKQSASDVLVVIEGSKSMRLLFCLAFSFLIFLVLVRERLSCGSPGCRGLYFGYVLWVLVCASEAQADGFVQPCRRSSMHAMHGQYGLFQCGIACLGFLILMETVRRSATVSTPCFSARHFAFLLFIGAVSVAGWYHAGSCALSVAVMRIVARFALYFLVTFSILIVSLFSFCALGPLVGTFQHCRKGFFLRSLIVVGGAIVLMMRSVIVAHVGRVCVKLRYVFSHIMSIASFLVLMLRRFSPPSSSGLCSMCKAILGEESLSQMKVVAIFIRAFSTASGIPCTWVRNCVWPPITAWMIMRRPSKVGCSLFQVFSLWLILSITGSQGVMSSALFPTQAPRMRMASPSFAMCILSSKIWSSSGFIFLCVMTFCLWFSTPMGTISVFSMLNFAPEIAHQLSRIVWT